MCRKKIVKKMCEQRNVFFVSVRISLSGSLIYLLERNDHKVSNLQWIVECSMFKFGTKNFVPHCIAEKIIAHDSEIYMIRQTSGKGKITRGKDMLEP